jgi:hypothetical protein
MCGYPGVTDEEAYCFLAARPRMSEAEGLSRTSSGGIWTLSAKPREPMGVIDESAWRVAGAALADAVARHTSIDQPGTYPR